MDPLAHTRDSRKGVAGASQSESISFELGPTVAPHSDTVEELSPLGDTIASDVRHNLMRPKKRAFPEDAKVGRLEILRELGAGGMGIVYLAYDPKLDREVAVKLIRGEYESTEARARLHREAQALARLSHPNVVGVHDVGTHEGQVWVSMEFVVGHTLDIWIARIKPSWRQVLEIIKQAARGIAAAHAQGLLHRDIKPSNIMVGADGRVRVMDFGLVRAEGEREPSEVRAADDGMLSLDLTAIGAIMGTPAYMAPEQFAAAVADERTDEFSLAITLWEALYGARPFVGDSFAELSNAVASGLRAPHPADSKVPKWLRRILDRALEVDRNRRFESVRVMLEAIETHEQRARARWIAAGLLLGMVAMTVLGALALVQWRAAEEARSGALAAEVAMRAERDRANQLLDTSTRITRELLFDVLPKYAKIAGTSEVQREVHERLRTILVTLRADADADEDYELAALEIVQRFKRGQLAKQHGRLDQARAEFEGALAAADQLGLDHPQNPKNERLQLVPRIVLGRLTRFAGELDTARTHLDRGLALAESLAAKNPSSPKAQHDLFTMLYELGELHRSAGSVGEARSRYTRALEIGAAMQRGDTPARFEKDRNPYLPLYGLGMLELSAGDLVAARGYAERALATVEALEDTNDARSQTDVCFAVSLLGDIVLATGETEAAREHYDRCRRIAETLTTNDPTDMQAKRALAATWMRLGDVALSAGDLANAQAHSSRAITAAEGLMSADQRDTETERILGLALQNLGDVEAHAGRSVEAHAHRERALNILDPLVELLTGDAEASFRLVLLRLSMAEFERREGRETAHRGHLEAAHQLLGGMAERGQIEGFQRREEARASVESELLRLDR